MVSLPTLETGAIYELGPYRYTMYIGDATQVTWTMRDGQKIQVTYQTNSIQFVDGRVYRSVLIQSGKCSLLPGSFPQAAPADRFGYYRGTAVTAVNPISNDSLMRSVEHAWPRNNQVSIASIDESIAAGGTANNTQADATPSGSEIYVEMGISQDSLGTSPHASYISLVDTTSGNTLARIKGAVNPYLSMALKIPYANNNTLTSMVLEFQASNGDSVAHWFFAYLWGVIP